MLRRCVFSFSVSNFKRVPVLYSLSIVEPLTNKSALWCYITIIIVNFYYIRISRRANLTRSSIPSATRTTRMSLFSML